jgi:hypothetical protein
MNGYIFFVNGKHAAHNMFDVSPANSAEDGRYMRLSALADKFKDPDSITSIYVYEVRSSNVVGRFLAEKVEVVAAKDDTPATVRARALRVENEVF